jgi:hypothetical protein
MFVEHSLPFFSLARIWRHPGGQFGFLTSGPSGYAPGLDQLLTIDLASILNTTKLSQVPEAIINKL